MFPLLALPTHRLHRVEAVAEAEVVVAAAAAPNVDCCCAWPMAHLPLMIQKKLLKAESFVGRIICRISFCVGGSNLCRAIESKLRSVKLSALRAIPSRQSEASWLPRGSRRGNLS